MVGPIASRLRRLVAEAVPRRARLAYSAGKRGLDPAWAATYGPRADRKSRWRIAAENAQWALAHGEVNRFYFTYGMDARSGPGPDAFLSDREAMSLIQAQIAEDGAQDVAGVLHDKYLFALVAEALGHRSPRNLAILDPDGVEWLRPRRPASYDTFLRDAKGVDGFVKPVGGRGASGTFALRVGDGRLRVDGEPGAVEDVVGRVGGRAVLQERVRQHPGASALHAASLNTVRLVTVRQGRRAVPLAAAFRAGVGGRTVDNWSAGGLVVSVDLETGRLRGPGLFKPECGGYETYGGWVADHPTTGVRLDGYPLPSFGEAVALACRFHGDLGRLRSVGWDLAFTPDGPCVVEGNTHWTAVMFLALERGFKDRYLAAVGGGP